MSGMKGLTIKLPVAVARRLKDEARESGRSVAAVVRDRLEVASRETSSVYAISSDLAGSLASGTQSATNARRKFRKA